MKLSDLKNDKVVVSLNEYNRKQFLMQAKSEGFKWSLTKDIQDDDCTFRVLIDLKLKTITNVSGMSYAYSQELRDLPIYNFEEKVLSLDK